MRNTLFAPLFGLALAALSFSPAAEASLSPETAYGKWKTATGLSIVELEPCAEGLCGEVVWVSPDASDPDPMGNGMRITEPFERTENGWGGGRVYVPERRTEVTAEVVPVSANQLKVRGCKVGVFCRTQIWTRVQN